MTMSQRGTELLRATEKLPTEEKRELVARLSSVNGEVARRSEHKRTQLWMVLLVGLFVLAFGAIVCTVVLKIYDPQTDTTALIALASAIVAGVIGLFANPPTGD